MKYRRITIVTLALFVAGCNMPLARDVESVIEEEIARESKESAQGADSESQNADQAESQDEKEVPPGYGQSRIEYDHEFGFNAMADGAGLMMEIKIDDYVSLQQQEVGIGPYWCKGETIDWVYRKFTGENQLIVQGTGLFSAGDEACSCVFSDVVDVMIEGITHSGLQNPDDECHSEFFSAEFNEEWYISPDWTCACDDPEKNFIAETNMEQILQVTPPGLSDKTLRFIFTCPGSFRQESFKDPTGVGTGSYQWTWRPGFDEGKNSVSTQPLEAGDWSQFPDGAPDCAWVHEPQWGPPLSSIDPGVTEWHKSE